MWRVPRCGVPTLLLLAACLGLGAVPAVARDLVIGQVAPFGGNLAVAGRDFNLGALIAIDEANAAGGVAGQRLRLVSRDDGYRAADTVRHVTSIIRSDAPVALIGLWGADSVKALLADGAIERAGLPVVGVRSGDVSLRSQALLFHVRASYRDEVVRMLEQIRTMGITRVAVAHEDEPFAHEALGVARDGMAKAGIALAAVEAVRRDSLDVEAAAQAIARVQPQAVLLFANTNAAAAIIRSLRERQATAFLFATSSVEADTLVAQIGPALARGVAVAQSVPNPYKATTAVAMAMRNRMRSLGIADERANFASLEGYICARVAIEAIRRAGREPRPSQVAAALDGLRRFDVGGFVVDFGSGQREGSRFVDLSVISAEGRVRQ